LKRIFRGWFWVPLVAAVLVAADLWTKNWIRATLPLNGVLVPIPALEPWLKFVHWNNTGAAFGILRGQGTIFIGIALVVIVIVLIYLRQLPADRWAVRLCLALQLGGAIGNLIDRLRFNGQVTDFVLLSLPVRDRVLEWPAFNVADSSIVVGVLLLAFLLLREDSQRAATPPQPAESAPVAPDESA
jgi:signal peptidase II